jgi:ribonuclease VapC
MILDTSAVIGIVLDEPESLRLVAKISSEDEVDIGTATLAECGVVLATRKGSSWRLLLENFFQQHDVGEIAFTSRHWPVAAEASERFGKGSNQGARLNFGDCLSYATARLAGRPLLHLGNDFGRTDLDVARP